MYGWVLFFVASGKWSFILDFLGEKITYYNFTYQSLLNALLKHEQDYSHLYIDNFESMIGNAIIFDSIDPYTKKKCCIRIKIENEDKYRDECHIARGESFDILKNK